MRFFPVASLTLLIAAFSASTAQAGFDCSASAGRITVLGKTVEPVAVSGPGDCTAESKSLTGSAAGVPAPFSAGTLLAATQVYSAQKTVLAGGGLTDLAIATPQLPIDLSRVPADVLDTIKGAIGTVNLSAVKSAIPVLPTNLDTSLPTSLKTDYVLGQLDSLTGVLLVTPLLVDQANARNAATNAANLATNTANAAINAANAAINTLRTSIPDTVTIDDSVLRGLLDGARLPSLDILRVRAAMANASGSCEGDKAVVNGWSDVAGIRVLGQDLVLDQVLDLARTLTNSVDPDKLALTTAALGLTKEQSDLIAAQAAGTLNTVLSTANATLQTALAGLDEIRIPLGVADIRIARGAQTRSGDSITQEALTATVSVAGQTLLDAVIGRAQASAEGVDCAEPVTDPQTPTGATLGCSTRSLVLVDVLERAGRVKLFGFADPAQAGKKVAIVFNATGRIVAHARINKDGRFDTTAPLPPASIRDTNAARYMATLGDDESINLKLRRRMVLTSMTSSNGRVTIAGRVVRPLSSPLRSITLTRRVSCTKEKVVTRFKPRSDGTFRVTVRAPKGVGTAVYRMTTLVPSSATGTGLFETYTLPRAVDIDR